MNTSKNSYTIIYATVLVVIVAFLLAFVSSALKEKQDKNVALDKKSQILASLNIRGLEDDQAIEARYAEVVVADPIVKADGTVLKDGKGKDKDGFTIDNKAISSDCLPLYVCKVGNETKYVVPMTGRGLWGALWGYVAIDSDLKTVYGAYFSHESETAGLGALIADEPFQDQFKGKHLFHGNDTTQVALTVVKHGAGTPDKADVEVDGVTGSTLTSQGVAHMVQGGLQLYMGYFQHRPAK